MARVRQLWLPLVGRSRTRGRRRGSRGSACGGVPHSRRPEHDRRHPLHVTVRVRSGLPSLRSQAIYDCVIRQFVRAKDRFVRIVHFSVQSNHVHILVEADDRFRLSQGMKGLGVRVARGMNRLLGCRGSVWADRFHARSLGTPREVRNVLVYVLRNAFKHSGRTSFDVRSSAQYLDGWYGSSEPLARGSPEVWPVAPPQTWLARAGWKRLGLIGPEDMPSVQKHGSPAVPPSRPEGR